MSRKRGAEAAGTAANPASRNAAPGNSAGNTLAGKSSAVKAPPRGGRLAQARLSLILAWRWVMRERANTALIVTLIAIPVIGMAAASIIAPSMMPTPQELATVDLGQTQAKLKVVGPTGSNIQQAPNGFDAWGMNGNADDNKNGDPPVLLTAADFIPKGAANIPLLASSASYETDSGVRNIATTVGDSWDPRLSGRFDLASGHAPKDSSEVLVTEGALERLGVNVGNNIELISPVKKSVTVTGVMDSRSQPNSAEMVFASAETMGIDDLASDPQAVIYLPDTSFTWDEVRAANQDGALVLSREVILDPPDVEWTDTKYTSGALSILYVAPVFAGFGALEVILLAGAAFLVSARKRERALATLLSVGAPRSAVFGLISASGIVLGIIGGVIGSAVGFGAGALFMKLTANGSATQYFGFHVWWPLFLGIVAVAALIGWLGALVPAFRATKVDIVAALRGARVPAKPKKRHPIIGVILAACGIGLLVLGGLALTALSRSDTWNPLLNGILIGLTIAGPAVTLLGLLMCSSLIVRLLAVPLSKTSLSARMASRDTVRNAFRSVPAIAAVMVTVFVATFAMVAIASSEQTTQNNYSYSINKGDVFASLRYWNVYDLEKVPDPGPYVAVMKHSLKTDRVYLLTTEYEEDPFDPATGAENPDAIQLQLLGDVNQLCPYEWRSPEFAVTQQDIDPRIDERCDGRGNAPKVFAGASDFLVIGGAAELEAILGYKASQAALDTLSSGGVVVFNSGLEYNGTTTFEWWKAVYSAPDIEAAIAAGPERSESLDSYVAIPRDKTTRFSALISAETATKLDIESDAATVLATPESPVSNQQVDALNAEFANILGTQDSIFAYVERGPSSMAGPLAWGLLGITTLISLGAAGVAIGLARADGRRDTATLWAVGAGPRLRRAIGFWQAWLLTGVGAVLGTALGTVSLLVIALTTDNLDFAAPWTPLAVTAFGMPLLIAAGTWLFTSRRAPTLARTTIG